MLSLSAFRALSFSSVAPATQAVRFMAVKAAATSTAAKPAAKKETPGSTKSTKATAAKTTKATKATTPTKAAKPVKAKKVAEKPKAKKIAPLPMPKRPSTPWNLFFMEHLDKVKASGEPIVPTVETANASVLWKQLAEDQKKVYEDKYRASFEIFKKQVSDRLQELTPAEFKQENARRSALRAAGKKNLPSLKDPNAPKRPLSSFFRFAQDQRKAGKFSDLPLKDQVRSFAAAWKSISPSEKTRYDELSRVALDQYKADKARYEAQHQ
ncbi:hypothetical protein EDD21DRAFT_393533 [Dissophora ornata]|nr:exp1-like protein [Dissophora ornata]KAI8594489.1 hypothetical protein EDD21DRAFT_393533 [Dissophora ornata]